MFKEPTIDRFWVGLAVMAALSNGCGADVLTALTTKTDQFVQNTAAMVDILWVVDNSNSMGEEQTGLGDSFSAFVSNLVTSGVDYHVGVISTDVADGGRLHTGTGMPIYIEPGTVDPITTFKQNVKVGIGGSARERGFETAALAVGKGIGQWDPSIPDPVPVPNAGFLRRGFCQQNGMCEGTRQTCNNDAECDDASLFIIFVSDEDDKSFGPVRYYWRLFESLKGPGNEARIKLSAIVGPVAESDSGTGGCVEPGRGSADPGDRYVDLVTQAGGTADAGESARGVIASICEDFNQSLTALSINAAGLKARFELSSLPNPNARIPCDDVAPAAFCVRVDGRPIAEDVSVARNGWSYDAGTNSIVFGVNSLPAPQSTINITYQELR